MGTQPEQNRRRTPAPLEEDGSKKLREIAEEEAKRIEKRGEQGAKSLQEMPKKIDAGTSALKDLDALLRQRGKAESRTPPPEDPMRD